MAVIEETKALPHIAIVPTPGMGHLFPLIEFAKRLVAQHNFAVKFIVATDSSSTDLQKKLLDSLLAPISYTFLPPATLGDISGDGAIETRIELTLTRSLPALTHSLKALMAESTVSAMVVDVFGSTSFDVASNLGIPSFIFFPCNAMVLSFFFHLPKLDNSTSTEYCHLVEPLKLPGCPLLHGQDLFSPLHDRNSEPYRAFVRMAGRYKLAAGIMVNSFVDLESGAFKALTERVHHNNPPVYPVGPLTKLVTNGNHPTRPKCLAWLDDQPGQSVMFVSFGSGGTLSAEQLTELAFGLENSGMRFLWVVRPPSEKIDSAFFGQDKSLKTPADYLPVGCLERTKERGLVVSSWAPQVEVLSHVATGGFLSHCGWNSTLESVAAARPLIAWPLYAEQTVNAVLLSEELGVALRVRGDARGVVGRVEIEEKAKALMEGEEGKVMRQKMRKLREAAELALGTGGSSTKGLAEVAEIWRSRGNVKE